MSKYMWNGKSFRSGDALLDHLDAYEDLSELESVKMARGEAQDEAEERLQGVRDAVEHLQRWHDEAHADPWQHCGQEPCRGFRRELGEEW